MLGWLLAPALASLAILVQFVLDVPRAPMLERDESSKSTPGNKRRKAAERRARARAKGYEPRSAAQVRRLRATWSDKPFEDEPTDQRFRRRHEALLRSVVTRVRAEVLDDGKAAPMQIRPSCRTIRCALELCAPEQLLAGIAELLPEVSVGEASLWHELREVEPTREPSERNALRGQRCRRWIADFAVEGAEVGDLQVPESEI